MQKNRVVWLCLTFISILCAAALVILCLNPNFNSMGWNSGSIEREEEATPGQYSYAHETIYAGKPKLDSVLFDIPFKKSDSYISNKELLELKNIDETDLENIATVSQTLGSNLFNVKHQDLASFDTASDYIDSNIKVYFNEDVQLENRNELIEYLKTWVSENETTIESEYITDKCMVYYDGTQIIVRGLLKYRVFETEDLATLQWFFANENLSIGRTTETVVEMYFIPGSNNNDFTGYKLASINFI